MLSMFRCVWLKVIKKTKRGFVQFFFFSLLTSATPPFITSIKQSKQDTSYFDSSVANI